MIYQFDPIYRKAYETSAIPFAVYHFVDNVIHTVLVTDGLCELMRTSRDALMDRFENDMYCNVEQQDAYRIAQEAFRYAREGGEYDVVYRERLGDDLEFSVIHAVGHHVKTSEGIQIAVVTYDDITSAIDSTARSQELFESSVRQFYENAEIAISVVAQEGDILLYMNKAFEKILPPLRNFDSGITYWQYFFDDDDPPSEHMLAGHCGRGRFIAEDPIHQHPVVMSIREGMWGDQKSYIIQMEDLEKVYLDPLTGLANQAYVELMAMDHIHTTLESGRKAVLIFYDVADMKLFNSRNGFDQGDELLKDIAKILSRVYSNSLQARLHADRFCLVTSDEDLEQKLRQVEEEVKMLDVSMKIEMNAGVRVIDNDEGQIISMLVDQAKIACDSIRTDVDRYHCYFDLQMEKDQQDQKFVNDHIDEAIANGEIIVYFQPVIRTLNRKLCGFEALSRWISPELGFLPPYQFISTLEESHQIHKLDCFVIEQICREYRRRADRGEPNVPISFNLSRLDFQMCDIFQYVQDMTAKYNVPHEMLCVEITESVFVEDDGRIISAIEKFHEEGYEVWMDDFGSGYSSLNSLKDYQFDKLKIDMVFLSSFTEKSRKIIEAIVQMAKTIGIHTLAEGVETAEQYDYLCSIGCEQVQGYYYGQPLPMEKCLEQVQNHGIIHEGYAESKYVSRAGATTFNKDDASCIVEYSGDRFGFLLINPAYEKCWEELGIDTVEETLKMVNESKGAFYDKFRRRIAQTRKKGGQLLFTFPFEDNYITMSMEILSTLGEQMILKLSMANSVVSYPIPEVVASSPTMDHVPLDEKADYIDQVRSISKLFNFCCFISMKEHSFEVINMDEHVKKVASEFGDNAFDNIHVIMNDILSGQDLEKALRFSDPDTLQDRLKKRSILTLEIYSSVVDRWYRLSYIGGEKADDGRYEDVVFCYGDITEDKLREIESHAKAREYRDQMYRDSLTGLHNRKYLDEQLMDKECSTVIMADIDLFKEVNDTLGHQCGDQVLAAVAKVLATNVRRQDSVVRYGGDEFTMVFENIPLDVLQRKLEDMREQIQEIRLEDHPDVQISMSFGAIFGPGIVYDHLIKADKALYEAKKDRNALVIHQQGW